MEEQLKCFETEKKKFQLEKEQFFYKFNNQLENVKKDSGVILNNIISDEERQKQLEEQQREAQR